MGSKRKIGIVGYGHLGQYLANEIIKHDKLELAFVWNRTKSAFDGIIPQDIILDDLSEFTNKEVDLIVEVAHPSISKDYGASFLEVADYMVGSPTALADQSVEDTLRGASRSHGMYIPTGAFWGGEDIKRMADRGSLQAVKVTMKKHPKAFKLQSPLKDGLDKVKDKAVVLYDDSVRGLCPLAPNNVNTMATAAIAAHNLGFDKVKGCLVADPELINWHVVEVEAYGAGDIAAGTAFHVHTVRKNPASPGAVTGSATYASFFSSLLASQGKGPGVHLC